MPRPSAGVTALLVVVVVVAAAVVLGVLVTRRPGLQGVLVDVARAVLDPRSGPIAVACSLVSVAALVATFVLAAATAGVVAAPGVLLGQALLALLAMAIPLGLAGWGPREAVSAAGFTAVGLGASAGVATTAVYGVLTLVAALPGGVLVLVRLRRAASGGGPLSASVPGERT